MDKIILKDLQFYGYHGLFEEENKLGQRFSVDCELYTSLKEAGMTDEMNASIHYGHAYELIRDIVEGKPKKLIEAVAETIAKSLFDQFPMLHACMVRVVKPNPPIHGQYESVAVEIYREREK
ncbi:dihydroneopterin aldolase [Pseudogracilibacillus sp. ICA-222130]|uniref:dihydroneopterin aldolase n=1 Tax=Pseudogracilibacillus sp. ICA-222130 TaxID=3134655 RepID=UPI0030C37442